MAEGVTNLNVPPPPDQPVVDTEKGALGRLAEKWRAWFTALGEVTNWTVTGDLAVEGDATIDGTITVGVGEIFGSNPLLFVRDEKASGTAGGDFNTGAWRTRTLNTVVKNQITGASLAANQVTLPAGTYRAWGRAPAFAVDQHQTRLFNVTGAAAIILGSTMLARVAPLETNDSCVMQEFTLSVASAIELQHQCAVTNAADGFGFPGSFGNAEVYAELWVEQVAVA